MVAVCVNEVEIRTVTEPERQSQADQNAPDIPTSGKTMLEFGEFLKSLPDLGEDAEAFARDIEEARNSYLPETDPWEE